MQTRDKSWRRAIAFQFVYGLSFYWIVSAVSALGLIPPEYESKHTTVADLIFEGKFSEAVLILDSVPLSFPENPKALPEFLELRALIARQTGDRKKTRQLYERLLELARTAVDAQPFSYHFELGVIDFENENFPSAKLHFESCLEGNFNSSLTHFYLGLIEYGAGELNKARDHFYSALGSSDDSLTLRAHLYLGKIEEYEERYTSSTRHQLAAAETANRLLAITTKSEPIYSLAQQTATEILKIYQKSGKGRFFGTVGFFGGHNTNVFTAPSESNGSDQGVLASPLAGVRFGGGYLSTPIQKFQWAPSYYGTLNHYLNEGAKGGSLFFHRLSLQGTQHPYRLSNYGFRVSGSGAFQNRLSEGQYRYSLHALEGDLTVFKRWGVSSRWALGLGLSSTFTKEYLDAELSDTGKRGGLSELLLLYLAKVDNAVWWNPLISLSLKARLTSGSDSRSIRPEIFFTDPITFGKSFMVIPGVGTGVERFHSRLDALRSDFIMTGTLSAIYRFKANNMELYTDLSYVRNDSDLDAYDFNRFFSLVGMNYSF